MQGDVQDAVQSTVAKSGTVRRVMWRSLARVQGAMQDAECGVARVLCRVLCRCRVRWRSLARVLCRVLCRMLCRARWRSLAGCCAVAKSGKNHALLDRHESMLCERIRFAVPNSPEYTRLRSTTFLHFHGSS